MAKPPELIKLAMEAVILIVGSDSDRNDISWENAKKIMRRPEFLKSMLDYNPDSNVVPGPIVKKL